MDRKYSVKDIDDLLDSKDKGNIYDTVISGAERMMIEKTLEKSFGNQSIASKILGINRNTLRLKIKKLEIDVNKFKI